MNLILTETDRNTRPWCRATVKVTSISLRDREHFRHIYSNMSDVVSVLCERVCLLTVS